MEKKMMRILSKLVLLMVLTGVGFAKKVATLSPIKKSLCLAPISPISTPNPLKSLIKN